MALRQYRHMELTRIGSAFGAAMGAHRHNARMRAAEQRISRWLAQHCRASRKAPRNWRRRIDASIDPVIAGIACAMLGWLLHRWL
jgi:hypothetical protein